MSKPIHALVQAANFWRQTYNPMRGLTIARAISLLEEKEEGRYCDVMWLFRFIEKRDATLRAVVRRRRSALRKIPWNIRTVSEDRLTPQLKALAERQQEALRLAYERIDNLRAAIGFLGSAEFRGFAHLEKHYDAQGNVIHLEPVPQWYWHRYQGGWLYDATAQGHRTGLPIDPANFFVREVEDPINEASMAPVINKSMANKDWAAFVEVFGVPSIFVEMPANTPASKEEEYLTMAEEVVGDARGVLPSGAKIQTPGSDTRGTQPFKEFIEQQDSAIVLAGTGGKLTMLTAAGSGTLAGNAHQDSFDDIAADEAGEIAELFQVNLDKPLLDRLFPGQPRLAYFELAREDEDDSTGTVERVVKLAAQGYRVADIGKVGEDLGLELVDAGAPAANPPALAQPVRNTRPALPDGRSPILPLLNRAPDSATLLRASGLEQLGKALQADFRPVAEELQKLYAKLGDEGADELDLVDALTAFGDTRLPALLKEIGQDAQTDKVLEKILGPAVLQGAIS